MRAIQVHRFGGPEVLELHEVLVGATYPLSAARQAHEGLRGRRTVGKLVLDPRR